MAQTTFSIRMDATLKHQFDALCAEFGMNVTTAFTVFAKTVVRKREIPFKISAGTDDPTTDWTPERWAKIDAMLSESERQFENGAFSDAFEDLRQAKVKYGL